MCKGDQRIGLKKIGVKKIGTEGRIRLTLPTPPDVDKLLLDCGVGLEVQQ